MAASADETHATISQSVMVPRAGQYRFWVRYADWANKNESFSVRIIQGGVTSAPGVSIRLALKDLLSHEFGAKDIVDPHNEMSMYWGWAFAWDSVPVTLSKGTAQISIEITKAAQARRQIDCFLLTNDSS